MKELTNPMQPVFIDNYGASQFKSNKIVKFLYEQLHGGMNTLMQMDFTKNDRQQFAQLIGYSVSGYSELNYVDETAYLRAQAQAETNIENSELLALRARVNELEAAIRALNSAVGNIEEE